MNKKELNGIKNLNSIVAEYLFDFYSKSMVAGFSNEQALTLTIEMVRKMLPDSSTNKKE